jgi:hypothetical protein
MHVFSNAISTAGTEWKDQHSTMTMLILTNDDIYSAVMPSHQPGSSPGSTMERAVVLDIRDITSKLLLNRYSGQKGVYCFQLARIRTRTDEVLIYQHISRSPRNTTFCFILSTGFIMHELNEMQFSWADCTRALADLAERNCSCLPQITMPQLRPASKWCRSRRQKRNDLISALTFKTL